MSAQAAHAGRLDADAPRPAVRGLVRLRIVIGASGALCAIALVLAAAGAMPAGPIVLVSGYCLLGNMLLFWLMRSGRSRGFKDPDCVFASHVFSISVLVLGCALIPEDRSAALQLVLLMWAFDLPHLSLREQSIAGSYALLGISGSLLASRLTGGHDALDADILGLATTALYLPLLVGIGHAVRSIRSSQAAQKKALGEALARLEELSMRDALTGASNRRHAQETLAREAVRQLRTGRPFAVGLVDLDHFKRINDLHGHAAGDAVLSGVARSLREVLPEACTVARWGGEEFLIIMPDTGVTAAAEWLERARQALGTAEWPDCPGGLRADFSAGVCAHRTPDAVAATVERADKALYTAKAAGRGRIVIDPSHPS